MTRRRSLPKSARLRRSGEIRAMFRVEDRRRCGDLEAYLRPVAGSRGPRLGVVVPKHGHTIVERNRLERRLREILRTEWLPAERTADEPRDLLVRASAAAYSRDFDELRAALGSCLDGAGAC